MSYICHKIINGKKYAYEVTSSRDPETKKVKKKNVYLGVVFEDGNIAKKQAYLNRNEKIILDFGDGYLLYEFIKKITIFPLLNDIINANPEIIPIMIYRMCYQSAMYNAMTWYDGNITSILTKNIDISSQRISRVLTYLGQEEVQRRFFKDHLNSVINCKGNVIIDATSLPNQINHSLSTFGHSNGAIEKQFRFLFILNQETKMPLFYRFLPGNIVDINSLKTTISELDLMGSKNNFVLLDAGYCSEENIKDLYQNHIDFLMRLPSQRSLYKKSILESLDGIEHIDHAVLCGDRVLFVKAIAENLYDNDGFVYIVLDPTRKAKEINKIIAAYLDDYKKKCYWISLAATPINFNKLKLPKDCYSCYINIENNNDQLIYMEKKTKKITLFPISQEKKDEFDKIVKNIFNETILSDELINKIRMLTGHKRKNIEDLITAQIFLYNFLKIMVSLRHYILRE